MTGSRMIRPPRVKSILKFPRRCRKFCTARWNATSENRFAGAKEFAAALAHPEFVEVIDRSARKERKPARLPFLKRILSYTMLLLMIPVVVFTLLSLVARLK